MIGEAVAVARANAAIRTKPVELAPVPAYRTRWQTPHERDPFSVPLEEKLALIRTAAAEVKKEKGVFRPIAICRSAPKTSTSRRRWDRPSSSLICKLMPR
jgi:predicted Zn-dependent protease